MYSKLIIGVVSLFSLKRITRLGGWLAGILVIALLCAWVRRSGVQTDQLPSGVQCFLPLQDLWSLVEDDSSIWVGAHNGLYRFDKKSQEQVPLPEGAPHFRRVRAMAYAPDTGIWIAHSGGINRWDGSWHTVIECGAEINGSPQDILPHPHGGMWVAFGKGVARVQHDGTVEMLAIPPSLALSSHDSLYFTPDGVLYLGGYKTPPGGLLCRQDDRWTNLTGNLGHPAVNAILCDQHGTLRIGTGFAAEGCAMVLRDGVWQRMDQSDGLAGEKVRSLMQDSRGWIWYGSEYNGVAITDGTHWQYLKRCDGLAGSEAKAMLEDSTGAVWLATTDGLTRLAPHVMKGWMHDL